MVKISKSLIDTNVIKEGIKNFVKKFPSKILNSKNSKKRTNGSPREFKDPENYKSTEFQNKLSVEETSEPSQTIDSNSSSIPNLKKTEPRKPRETFKLKFRNFTGTFSEFKALLDSEKSLGPYGTVNFRPKKVVVSFSTKDTLNRYLDHFNKFTYKDQILKVSVLDYFSTVKQDYKTLSLTGVSEEFDTESVENGLRRRINIDFRLTRESGVYRLSFKNVSDCVKANSILNNSKLPLVKDKKEHLVKVNTSMELFGKSSKNSSRVFVRNLPFQTGYEDLVSFFKNYDKGSRVHIPRNSKGFAFITFSSLEKAKKVIDELNGTLFKKRRIQLTLSLPKELYDSKAPCLNQEDGQLNGDSLPDRVESHEENLSDNDLSGDSMDEDENDDTLKDTLFVRNLDYGCTETELLEYFSKFGEVESCNICRNEDKSSKGTAFVRFKNKEHVKKILENERLALLRDQELNSQKPVLGLGYSLRGRRLKLDPALAKDKAKVLKDQKVDQDSKRVKEEKNMHLLMVGVVKENSPEFKNLSQKRQESAKLALEQKLQKIKQKNTYVNPTRICIKNLPSNINSNDLRTVINKHLKSSLSPNEYMGLKKLKNRGVVDVRLLTGDSYTKDNQGIKVKKKKPFAFVEFIDHNIAMKTLEFFSHNNTLYPPKTLQCEFTVDTRYDKDTQTRDRKSRLKKKKYSRGKRQRERRRLLKQNQLKD